jgi:hypothetical protein
MLPGLTSGEQLPRRAVHARFGGNLQGGIAPSRKALVVMFFTDPVTGHRHGYYDGLDQEGYFEYVGEGQRGDQQLTKGNKAILEHAATGRSLEGFLARGKVVTYLGEFRLHDHYFRDAHETGDQTTLRQVVVFRLESIAPLPVDLPPTPVTPSHRPVVDEVAVEGAHTEGSFLVPGHEAYPAERREAELVRRYRAYLESQHHTVSRLRVVPPTELAPLYSDLWDTTDQELIEAKASVTREQVRMAVGQLLDYGRFAGAATRAILLPECPRDDLVAYVHSVGIKVVFPTKVGWTVLSPP